ncbi:tyrosine-type recombinase/integrase [Aestuariibius sp. 2305UL40-4]|uniref:tyrosine-type recombinase/integrase n=1 Tax=Aestuariibius violaceus TaxID=3234132 RepID=UPI00345E4867
MRLYHRKTGVRLPDLPEDHPDFIAAWMKEENAGPKPTRHDTGTLGAACRLFEHSAIFRGYSDVYRNTMSKHLGDISGRYGKVKTSALRERHIASDLARFDGHAARTRLKAWRSLFAWATSEGGLMESDPSRGLRRARVAKSDGYPPWTPAEIAQVREAWPIGTRQRAALELLHWTGARAVDGRSLTRGMIDSDGVLRYRQSKTGSEAFVPMRTPLPEWCAELASDLDLALQAVDAIEGKPLLFLETAWGRARTAASMSNYVSNLARSAGVAKSAHGLRKTRLIALAEIGATSHQLMAWCGHLTLAEVERYTRLASRRRTVMGTERKQNLQNEDGFLQNGPVRG